ncbi:MAG TPA: hypothetical protein VGR47_09435 [Terracidiphilus sp.]|nr:hypothetical protein [Terracidiphilus sp.]
MKELLRRALPPVDTGAEPARDLWPLLLKRLDARPAAPAWFDWALIAGLLALAALFPTAIPVFLYYL